MEYVIQVGNKQVNKSYIRLFPCYEIGNLVEAIRFKNQSDAEYEIFKIHVDSTNDFCADQLFVKKYNEAV